MDILAASTLGGPAGQFSTLHGQGEAALGRGVSIPSRRPPGL